MAIDNTNSGSEDENPPDRETAKKAISTKRSEDSDLDATRLEAEDKKAEINGKLRLFDLREKWSSWIVWWINFFIVFHFLIVVVAVLHPSSFTQIEWLVSMIVIQDFLQVVGMGYIVTKFLYPAKK